MKRLVVLVGCCVFLLAVAGCGQQNERMSNQPELELADQNQQEVLGGVWQGGTYEQPLPDFFGDQSEKGVFPEFLVGVWEAQSPDYNWGIQFGPDGSILKIIHHVAGQVRLEEGGIYGGERTEGDTYYVFIMGPCEADYIPSTGVLKVKVVVDYFKMKLPTGELEGKMEDYFEGPVSEDGERWDVSWRNYTWVEGADPPDPNVIEANPETLVFARIHHVHGTE